MQATAHADAHTSRPRPSHRMPEVHVATTREEREAIYRFRYEVYVREFGRRLGEPDHERRWVRDQDDESAHTTILYTGTPQNITACVRLRHWPAGQVPAADVKTLSLDRIPRADRRSLAEIERLMVHPDVRGKLLVAALVKRSYEILVGEHGSEMVFCYCSPGLMHFYRRIAMRPYGGRLVNAPDGLMIPMVSVTSDTDYYRQVGSYLTPMVDLYYGQNGLPPVDLEPLRDVFANTGITWEKDAVLDAVRPALEDDRSEFLGNLTDGEYEDLVGHGLVIEVEEGTLVTRRGFRELELYVVLEGEFATDDGRRLGVGDHFGEESLLHEAGRRAHTVRARTAGKLLVLRGVCLQRVLRRRMELATALRQERRLPKAA